MILHPLSNEERATFGGTHRAIITYADLVSVGGANNTATIPLFTVANNSDGTFTANKEVNVVNSLLAVPFSGTDGTLISTAMTMGDSGNNSRLLASQELNAAGAVIYGKGGALASNVPYVPAAATTFNAYFTGTAAKALNTLTAGEVHLILDVIAGPVAQGTGQAAYPL
jgi:hypothetical protein